MQYESIQSPQNPRVKNLLRLRNRQQRHRQKKFLIEGRRELNRALAANIRLSELYFTPELFSSPDHQRYLQKAALAGVQLFRLSRKVFCKCAYREGPDGLLGVAAPWQNTLEEIPLSTSPLLLVVEGVEKPGNLGALIRTAEAAGVDAVIALDLETDIFNPNVIRASQGALFALTVIVSHHYDEIAAWLEEHGIPVIATTPQAPLQYWQADFTSPTALLVGSEKNGLTDYWLKKAEMQIKIPLAGQGDSLNVSASAAIVLFEAVRQRAGVR